MSTRINLSLFLVFFSFQIFAQSFGLIADEDGYVNVRKSPKTGNNIISTLNNGHLVLCFDGWDEAASSNWMPVDFIENKETHSGYIHRSRIKFLDSFEKIPLHKTEGQKVVFRNENISIQISKQNFYPDDHILTYEKNGTYNFLAKIDGKNIWGTDGNLPRTTYRSIDIQINGKQFSIPSSELQNLFEPNIEYTSCNYDKENDILYISSFNSDGAGGYAVLWKFKNGKFSNRIILYPF